MMKTVILFAIVFGLLFMVSKARGQSAQFERIQPSQARNMHKEKDVVFLDVRTPNEVAAGKIKGAQTINVMDASFTEKVEKLDRSKRYVVYCRSGRRSARACEIMSKQGFQNLYNLEGGFMAW